MPEASSTPILENSYGVLPRKVKVAALPKSAQYLRTVDLFTFKLL